MNAKAKAKKNLTRLIALVLAGLTFIGMLASCNRADTTTGFNYSSALTKDGFFKGITATDYVTLPDYSGYEMPESVTVASQEEVDSEIFAKLSAYTKTEKDETIREVVEGDMVNMDYTGSIDGVEFEGGSTKGAGTNAVIGAGNFIEGFEEQIVGHKPGETFDIFVTFPEEYHSEDLAGKDAVFSITLNYLCKEITPDFNDEFVAANFADQYASAAEMKAGIEKELAETRIRSYILEKLFTATEISEYPQAMMDYEKEAQKAYLENMAAMYGMTGEDLVIMQGVESMDAYLAQMEASFKETIKMSLMIQAIAEKEGLKVTDEDIKDFFVKYYGTEDYSMYESAYGIPYLKSMILSEVVLEHFIEVMPVVAG